MKRIFSLVIFLLLIMACAYMLQPLKKGRSVACFGRSTDDIKGNTVQKFMRK